MKHLIINEFGLFLGLKSQRVVISKNKKTLAEHALKNLKTISVKSRGVSLSADLVLACSERGVKIFFNDFNSFAALHGSHEHKGARILQMQFASETNGKALALAKEFIKSKIKNQRSTILYFSRTADMAGKDEALTQLSTAVLLLESDRAITRDEIFGIEGSVANAYFDFLRQNSLLPPSFEVRSHRHSSEITNIALNYGYAILQNFIYKSVINAGLNPYFGVLHTLRSAKPSLVLDIMEEYRSFVVDRNIIKMRASLHGEFSSDLKRAVATNILNSFSKKLVYNKRKLTLESIIQRQIYRIGGYFCDDKKYKSYIFRW